MQYSGACRVPLINCPIKKSEPALAIRFDAAR